MNRNKNLASHHILQMEIKKKKAEEEFVKDQEDAYKTKMLLGSEQDEFYKYAEGWVGDYHDQGKDITPLILELKNYKKRMFYGDR
jgi:hypothetical protein